MQELFLHFEVVVQGGRDQGLKLAARRSSKMAAHGTSSGACSCVGLPGDTISPPESNFLDHQRRQIGSKTPMSSLEYGHRCHEAFRAVGIIKNGMLD
jgi:hypothetical protein